MTEKKHIPFGRPLIGEEEKMAVEQVLSGPILVHGPKSEEFESAFASFTNAPNAVSVASCTAGMHLIYHALGLGSGDEVIVPAQTHVATAHAVRLTGARPVFVDVELETGNVKIPAIEEVISPQTKAIAVVHYLGAPVNMDMVNSIAKKHDLFVLEDCALSPGASFNGTHTGLLGDAGCFSFYPVKHLTTAEGGMIILKSKTLTEKVRLLKAFGVNRSHGERKIPGEYDVTELGYNYRMSEVHAAIGIEQIKKLPDFLDRRKRNFECLREKIHDNRHLTILPQPVDALQISSHYCMGALLSSQLVGKRPEIMDELKDLGIGTSIYYPHPVPDMTYYRKTYKEQVFPNARLISNSIIALPVGPHLEQTDMERVGEALIKVLTAYS
jgi:perosamine synthetase